LTARAPVPKPRFYAANGALEHLLVSRTPVTENQNVVELGMLSLARTLPFHKRDGVTTRCAPSWLNRFVSAVADDRLTAARAASVISPLCIDTFRRTARGPINILEIAPAKPVRC
jgi:hypothetical protein